MTPLVRSLSRITSMKTHLAARRPLSVISRRSRSTVALLAALAVALPSSTVQAQTSAVPSFISYQGKVTTGAGTSVGATTPVNRTVTFRIWDSPTASLVTNLIYSEQQVATISEGEFSVLIGQGTVVSGTPLGYSEAAKGPGNLSIGAAGVFGGAARYLGITIDDGNGNLTDDPEISPRQQIVTSAYAFRSKFAEFVGANGAQTITALDNGHVGIGTSSPGVTLEVNGTMAVQGGNPAVGVGGGAGGGYTFRGVGDSDGGIFSPADGVITVRTNAVERLRVNPSGTVNIGSGNNTQFTTFEVNGSIAATPAGGYVFTGADTDTGMFSASDNILLLKTGGQERIRIDTTGKVGLGVGNGVNPSFAFEVRNATPEMVIGKTDGTAGALYFGNSGHGVKRVYSGANDVGLYTSSGDVYLSGAGTSTSQFVLKSGGNVGIGTSSTTERLNVAGNIRTLGAAVGLQLGDSDGNIRGVLGVANTSTDFSTDAAARDVILRAESGSKLLLQSNTGASAIAITSTNNVGIGTNAPTTGLKLDVRGNAAVSGNLNAGATFRSVFGINTSSGVATHDQGAWLEWNKVSGNGMTYLLNQKGNGGGGIIFGEVDTANGISERMRIAGDGRVGIGTNSPIAPLHVAGGSFNSFNFQAYMDANGISAAPNETRADLRHTIIADDRMRATAYDVASDARIKNVVGKSSGSADLDTLLKLEITDYTFKDTIGRGETPYKKVIAQQVESVYPQAVTTTKDVVPDIFKKAALKDGWIELATDLKLGERVRLLADPEEGIYEVLEVEAGRFRTAFAPAVDSLFVYGRQVSDFRVVDYDALSMLNISATQQLKRDTAGELQALRAENSDLRARLVELEARDKARDARLASIEQLLGSGNVVMARPEAPAARNGQE